MGAYKRIEYIDYIRGFAIFLVTLGHVLEYSGYHNSPLYLFIYAFHMPLFFCISGFVMSFSYEKKYTNSKIKLENVFKFIYHKFKSIMIPYYAWSLIALPLFFYCYDGTLNYKGIFDSVFIYNTSFWFLPCLFGLSVVYIIYKGASFLTINSSIVSKVLVLTCLTIVLFAIYNFTEFDFFRSIISYVLPFFIGVFMSEYKRFNLLICDNVTIYSICLIVFCLIVGLFILPPNEVFGKLSRLLCGVLSIPVFFFFFKNTKFNLKLSKFLNMLGMNTLVIYVLNFSFIRNLPVIPNLNLFMQLFVFSTISVLLIALFLTISRFFEHSRVLSLIFLRKK